MSKSVKLILPYPPSANHYLDKRVAGKPGRQFVQVYLSKKAKQYHRDVEAIIRRRWPRLRPTSKRVFVHIVVILPDKRKRDADNIPKVTFDSLTKAGFWRDDDQVYDYRVTKSHIENPGRLEIMVTEIEEPAGQLNLF